MAIERLKPNVRRWLRRTAAGMALLVPLLGCGGAQLSAGVVFDYPVYYVDRPPPRFGDYPYVYYHGRPAYLISGRWYYRTQRGWVYFREEPRELRAYRERRDVSPLYRFGSRPPRVAPTERRRYGERDLRDEPTQRRRRSVDD